MVQCNARNGRVSETHVKIRPKGQTIAVGEKAPFTMEVSGDNLTHLWDYSKNYGSTWSK